jgi:hypothetical protein
MDLTDARLTPLSADLVAARIGRTCGSASEQRVALVRLAASGPAIIEHLVLAPLAGETLTVRTEDRDGDGHPDVVAHLSLHDLSGESADVDLAWLDRAAGLSRETAEPETTIAARATEARNALRRQPDRALAAARTAVLVHDAVCGASARLAVLEGHLDCPASSGLGRALAVTVAAEARRHHLAEALDALAALSRSDASVRDADRTTARDALAAMDGVARPPVHDATDAHPVPGGDVVRLSSLAFLDEDRVLVRGTMPRTVILSTSTTIAGADGDTNLVDASRAHRVDAIERACEGYSIVVRPVFGPLDSPSLEHTLGLIEAQPPPPGATCGTPLAPMAASDEDLSIAQRGDRGGWHVLGWAPQGVLVARDTTLVLVPLDLSGASVGAPVTLAATDPAPAPIVAGHATADASAWALSNAIGLVLQRRGAEPRLIVPVSFQRAEGLPIDVAVSPSAARLAWIENGHVRWVDLNEPAPPPTSTTPGR